MTEEQKVFYEGHFRRYGHPAEEMNTEYRMYLPKPDRLMKPEDIAHYDQKAAEDIKALERYIEFMKLYRSELVRRYNELETEPFVEVVRLRREKQSYGQGKVFFYFSIYKRYINDGKETLISNKKYEGKQRREAIQDFDQYVKDHPSCVPEKNIEKKSWER